MVATFYTFTLSKIAKYFGYCLLPLLPPSYHISNVHYFTATYKFKMKFNNLMMFTRE